jgi:predicted methyltransferase
MIPARARGLAPCLRVRTRETERLLVAHVVASAFRERHDVIADGCAHEQPALTFAGLTPGLSREELGP